MFMNKEGLQVVNCNHIEVATYFIRFVKTASPIPDDWRDCSSVFYCQFKVMH